MNKWCIIIKKEHTDRRSLPHLIINKPLCLGDRGGLFLYVLNYLIKSNKKHDSKNCINKFHVYHLPACLFRLPYRGRLSILWRKERTTAYPFMVCSFAIIHYFTEYVNVSTLHKSRVLFLCKVTISKMETVHSASRKRCFFYT